MCFFPPILNFTAHIYGTTCEILPPYASSLLVSKRSPFTKQVIVWRLEDWNSGEYLEKVLSREPFSKAASAVDVPYFPRSHFTLAFQSAPPQGIQFPLISGFAVGWGMKMEIQISHCVILSSLIWINLFHAAFCQNIIPFLHRECGSFVSAINFPASCKSFTCSLDGVHPISRRVGSWSGWKVG